MTTLKEQLYLLCSQYISHREAAAKTMIADIREAVANETKSSAGDKYETSREMMQQEIEQHMARLNELHKMRTILQHISTTHSAATVTPGAVVYTNNGNYYYSHKRRPANGRWHQLLRHIGGIAHRHPTNRQNRRCHDNTERQKFCGGEGGVRAVGRFRLTYNTNVNYINIKMKVL